MARTGVRSLRRGFVALAIVFALGCTYAPEEERVVIGQVVRLGDSYRALVIVQHDRFRQPTGLSAFPDGGKWKFLERDATQYLIHARDRTARVLAHQVAPDSLWESFSVRLGALEGETIAYLVMTGCPRGGECHPKLHRSLTLRLSLEGEIETVDGIPPAAGLPGVMLARRHGEEHYMRLRVDGDIISARFDEDGGYEPVFHLLEDGSLVSTEG
jgi:hypothetical protein